MWGSITNPYFSENDKEKTIIHVKNGKFSLIDPLENGFLIELSENCLIEGNTREHFTELKAPRGKIVGGFIRNTVKLEADSIMVVTLEDHVLLKGRNISILGNKVTYDVIIELQKGGMIKFHDQGSGFDISDDAILRLENGKEFRLHDLKKSEMIGYGGADITYDYLDKMGAKKTNVQKQNWKSKFGFRG